MKNKNNTSVDIQENYLSWLEIKTRNPKELIHQFNYNDIVEFLTKNILTHRHKIHFQM